MAYDGICLKAITAELKSLVGYKIDKIFEPNKNNIVLGLYGEHSKFALNISIDSKYYRLSLTTHPKPNPMQSLNFCMLLRKHILGYKIKSIITYGLERLVLFELEPFDEFENEIKYLIVELMGKHSNIILTDKNKVIIDSIRHTNVSKNSYRNVFPRQNYVMPMSNKLNTEDIKNFDQFFDAIKEDIKNTDIRKVIANKFVGISLEQITFIVDSLGGESHTKENIERIYEMLLSTIKEADNANVQFQRNNENGFCLSCGGNREPFNLNFFIDDFYYEKETHSDFVTLKGNVLKMISVQQKKYNKRLQNINKKLQDCDNMNTYKLYGELLTANLYKYNGKHLENVTLLNYYDNSKITIPLDIRFNFNDNCKKYYKKYSKLKNALTILQKQKEDTLVELDYIESIMFELENATNAEELKCIYDEISENSLLKKNYKKFNKKKKPKNTKNKTSFNPLTFDVDGYTVLVGRNNKENDWLTTKFASSTDLWFHTKDIHGSHVILKTNGTVNIDESVLIKCAVLAVKHSKGKDSSNVPVDYTLVKFVKKPNGAKPGMVIYTHNKTLYVTP